MPETTVPLGTVPPNVASRLKELGAPPEIASVASYRSMSVQPDLLLPWVELSWRLRLHAVTPRRLRELVITRTTILQDADFERKAHEKFAREAGVTEQEIEALVDWQTADTFSEAERTALELSDAMHDGGVSDDLVKKLQDHFDPASLVELILTVGFYEMVPRVNDALRV